MSAPGEKPSPAAPAAVLPFVLLGLMTLAAFGGPFVIALAVRGGEHSGWPPDRPVEWWVFGLVTGAVVVLMGACVTAGLWARPAKKS
jgi:hypothetical protein